MIIVRLVGGLGNQMFQYAVGRALAARLGVELKIDRSYLDGEQRGETRRSYELDCFRLASSFASSSEIARFAPVERELMRHPFRLAAKLCHRVRGRGRVLVERRHCFDEELLRCGDNSYLVGFWQSEKYFAKVRDLLLEEFSFRKPLTGKNADLARQIAATEAVSLHVRRGDYYASREAAAFHAVCDEEYYRKAVEHVSRAVSSPHFYLFSDDPDWVRENLHLDFPSTVVDHNSRDSSYLDMQLISLCRHNIGANSSFSWWGAWLNRAPDKIAVVPERWFNDPSVDTRDVIPEGWVKIPVGNR